jgi:hypothetical protein
MDAVSAIESPWLLDERHGIATETGPAPEAGQPRKTADTREKREVRKTGNAGERRDARRSGDARNIIEALGNLFYLIQLDAEQPHLVRDYTAQAEERLNALIALLPERALPRDPHHGLKLVAAPTSGKPE